MAVIARRDIGPPEWTFDDVAELADWRDHHDLEVDPIMKVRDLNGSTRTILKITSMGENPFIYPGGSVPNWEAFSGYDHGIIYVGARVSDSDMWQVDYITSRNGEYSEARSRKFRVDATGDFEDLEFEMQWENMIRGFRIHPGADQNKETEIDYISLRGPVLVTQAPRRLATTWGRIKDLF
jgi:hypothetical protein